MPPEPPPEAVLIRAAREAAFGGDGMSVRAAARRTSAPRISEGTWRRVESAAGVERKPAVLAAMAAVVGVTAAQLTEAGRMDAAGALQQRIAGAISDPDVAAAVAGGEGDMALQALMADILAQLAAIDGSDLPRNVQRQLRADYLESLRRDSLELQRHLRLLRITAGQ
jgi:hypothetical protein